MTVNSCEDKPGGNLAEEDKKEKKNIYGSSSSRSTPQ